MGRNQETCEITIGGQVHVGVLPRAPVAFKLHRELQNAMGFTNFDRKLMAERKEGEPPIEPSEEGDEYALPMIYLAALGLCWPSPIEPTFRQCKHDAVEFGEVVFEYFVEQHGSGVLVELQDEGRRLLALMVRNVTTRIANAVEEERGNSAAQEETSTTG